MLGGERAKVFGALERINREVDRKAEAGQRLRASLSSSSQEVLDHQIRRLEEQMNRGHFRLAEADRLRRSRRSLGEWQEKKGEVEVMRKEQRVAREAREGWEG